MKRTLFVIAVILGFSIWSCEDESSRKTFFEDENLTIYEYLEVHSDDYSMLIELIDKAGYQGAFSAFGSYTFFAFKNEPFEAYLQEKGMSINNMTQEEARTLVRYHAFASEITSSSLGTGKLPEPNLSGDQIVSRFDESGLQGIIINRESRVTDRDIRVSNGVMHVLEKPLTPIVESVAERIANNPDYSIFAEALEKTGLHTLLNDVYDTTGVDEVKRNNFTLFAETDAIFQQKNINSYQELVSHLSGGSEDPSSPESALYKFVANHIIADKTLFLKDFDTGNYQAYNGELLNFQVDQSFKINSHMEDGEQQFITFLTDAVDYQAKNGVFHSIDDLMVVFRPDPVEVIWEFSDQPVVRDLEREDGQDSKHYTTLDPFPNMHGTIAEVWRHGGG